MSDNIKICSMNVRGISCRLKRQDLFDWLKRKKMGIYCLQDVHIASHNQNQYKIDWGSYIIFSSITSNSRGVMVMFNNRIDYEICNVTRDEIGNLLLIELKVSGKTIILGVLYGPNKDEPVFYDNIIDDLRDNENLPIILCGDWNLVSNFKNDTFRYAKQQN